MTKFSSEEAVTVSKVSRKKKLPLKFVLLHNLARCRLISHICSIVAERCTLRIHNENEKLFAMIRKLQNSSDLLQSFAWWEHFSWVLDRDIGKLRSFVCQLKAMKYARNIDLWKLKNTNRCSTDKRIRDENPPEQHTFDIIRQASRRENWNKHSIFVRFLFKHKCDEKLKMCLSMNMRNVQQSTHKSLEWIFNICIIRKNEKSMKSKFYDRTGRWESISTGEFIIYKNSNW